METDPTTAFSVYGELVLSTTVRRTVTAPSALALSFVNMLADNSFCVNVGFSVLAAPKLWVREPTALRDDDPVNWCDQPMFQPSCLIEAA